MAGEPGEYRDLWPQHGEYANTTNFVTQDNITEAMEFETGPPVNELALFSDGIERLVLDLSTRTVHSPAFRPIFEWLACTEGLNPQSQLDFGHFSAWPSLNPM